MIKKWFYLLTILGLSFCSLSFAKPSENSDSKFIINNNNVLNANQSLDNVSYDEGTEINDGSLVVTLSTVAKTETSTSLKVSFSCDTDKFSKDYYIGYYNSDKYLPGVIKCNLINKNGESKFGYGELLRVNDLLETNQAGVHLGQTSFDTYCDIVHEADYFVDLESTLKVLNIFNFDSSSKEIDLENNQFLKVKVVNVSEDGSTSKSYVTYDINSFLSLDYAGRSNLNGYSSFKVNVDASSKEVDGEGYKSLGLSYKRLYNSNEDAIKNGSMKVRTKFGFGGDSYYKISYKDGTYSKISDVSNSVDVSSKGSSVYFLLNGLNHDNLEDIQVIGGIVTLSIYNNSTYKDLSRTNIQIRFGYINFKINDIKNSDGTIAFYKNNNAYDFNSDLFIGLSVGLVSFFYFGVSLVLFFIYSKKYKDDEFRRINPRLYWKTNILGLFTIDCVLLFVEFTIVRVNLISNSLPIFNPCDAFICAFAVASLLLVGYFIKYFFVLIKAKYEAYRNEKLKMNSDVIDDGTLIIK